jgi:hypothetical protein
MKSAALSVDDMCNAGQFLSVKCMCGFLQCLWGFMDGWHHRDRSLGTTLTLDAVKSMSRDNLERDLTFVSLLLFRNELKKDTRAAIEALREGQVRETTQ